MDFLSGLFSAIWSGLKKAVDALRHVKFADIWHAIQRAWSRFHRALLWYKKYILDPLQKQRQKLIDAWNKYIGPIVKLLDTLRSTVRILAIFDRQLAVKIDAALWQAENFLYQPLYTAIRRINALTSFVRAIVTPLGLLDRALLVQSLERDWKSLWRVLLNNGQFPAPNPGTVGPAPLVQMDADFKEFVQTGTGPFADTNTALEQVWSDTLSQVG